MATSITPAPKGRLLTTAQIIAKYGPPGTSNLIQLNLPYPMRIAWDLQHSIKTMQCHKLVAPAFKSVFEGLQKYYGTEQLTCLGIDLYGGCYNFRKMRGGTDWSRHSWGIALDLDPARNLLKETSRTARFARMEYGPMIKIFYEHGFVSLGVEKNYDWMHFEIGA